MIDQIEVKMEFVELVEASVDTDEESEIDECTFVKLVECRPWLYDSEHPKYKNNIFKDETWRLIANSLGWEDDEDGLTGAMKCRNAWKRLRGNFMRALRKLQSGAGADDIDVLRKKPVYELLMFLRKIKNTRKSSGNFNSSVILTKKRKVVALSAPKEQWTDSIILKDEYTEGMENKESSNVETRHSAKQIDFVKPGPSGAAVELNNTSSPLAFEAPIKL